MGRKESSAIVSTHQPKTQVILHWCMSAIQDIDRHLGLHNATHMLQASQRTLIDQKTIIISTQVIIISNYNTNTQLQKSLPMIWSLSTYSRITIRITAMLALTLGLWSCGGGNGQNEVQATLSNTEYLGNWYPINKTCQSNFYYNPALYVGAAKLVVSADTLQTTVTAYADAACTQAVGTLTRNYVLTASLGSVTGKDNVAKWAINLLNNSYTTTIPTLTKSPGILTEPEYLDLADVQGGLLYRGDSSNRDARGFPTALQNSATYTRTEPANEPQPVSNSVQVTSAMVNGVSVDITQPVHVKRGDALKIMTDKVTNFRVASYKNGASIQTTIQYLDDAKGLNTNTWFGAVYSESGSTLQVSYLNTATQSFVPFNNLSIQVEADPVVDTRVSIASVSVNGVTADLTRPISVKNGDALQITTDKTTNFDVASFKNGVSIPTTIRYLDDAKGLNTKTWYGTVYSEPGSTLQVSYIDAATQSLTPFNNITINIESAYEGVWTATYTGGDSGSCNNMSISKTGALSAVCSSASLTTLVTLAGTVNAQGGANFASGTASTGASFSGSFGTQTATGTWTNNLYGIQGTWTATRR